MSRTQHYYNLCNRHQGRTVRIIENGGYEHVGRIVRVTPNCVYLECNRRPGWGGFGYGYGGYYGYRPYVYPVALAAIGGFVLGAALFW
ncbi:hypothetical protein [Alteribacter populi]|uniref:hypothetical protein n=1 Tax=Alteribacter populi TaxID=2011011 RepID=UPI000BBA7C79|nr:hypothetical protein [Alteribacter populi]